MDLFREPQYFFAFSHSIICERTPKQGPLHEEERLNYFIIGTSVTIYESAVYRLRESLSPETYSGYTPTFFFRGSKLAFP